MITGINYVSLPVSDMAVARHFYGDVLGLTLRLASANWLEFQLGMLVLALYPAERGELRGGDVAFSVTGLDTLVQSLKLKGVVFKHGIETFELPTSRGKLARFADPFGNRLELVESA